MQNGYNVARSRTSEVLVALCRGIVEIPIRGAGEKGLRLHFRVHCLTEDVVKSEAKNERTQIVNAGDAAKVSKSIFCVEAYFVPPLVNRRTTDAPVKNTKVVQVHVGLLARLSTKLYLRRPASAGEIFGPRSEVHAAIDGPEY